MKTSRFPPKPIALIVGALFAAHVHAQTQPSGALPTGAQVIAGQATVSQSGNRMDVLQSSQQAIINWNSFNIGSQSAVNFQQPSSSAIALNRVLSTDPSLIFGSLTANGQVFLVNPNGILFGAGAQVNVGGLVASTLDLANNDFLAGNYRFSGGNTAGSITNQGDIGASPQAYVALISPRITNSGTISTPQGTIALAAGDSVTLQFAHDRLLSYEVASASVDTLIENSGSLRAEGGLILLSAKTASDLATSAINNGGLIDAASLTSDGGVIRLEAAQKIRLGGTIDASGAPRGGQIIAVADMTSGTTTLEGNLRAQGGEGGQGGFVETSGAKVKVSDQARVDTRATHGKAGLWLIDPNDYIIATSGGDITGATLSSQLLGTNVTIDTANQGHSGNGDIVINDIVNWNTNQLTLAAERDIQVNAAMAMSLGFPSAPAGALELKAGRSVSISANIVGQGGSLNVLANDPNRSGVSGPASITTGPAVMLDLMGGTIALDLRQRSSNPAGDIALLGQLHAGSLTVKNTNGNIQFGSSNASFFGDVGNVLIQTPNTVLVEAGSGSSPSSAILSAQGTVQVDAHDLTLHAGSGGDQHAAIISSHGNQIINVTHLSVEGNGNGGAYSGNMAELEVSPPISGGPASTQRINIATGGSITVSSGNGNGTNAPGRSGGQQVCNNCVSGNSAIIYSAGNQTISFADNTGTISLTGGSAGTDNLSTITAEGTQTIGSSSNRPSITLTGGTGGTEYTDPTFGLVFFGNTADIQTRQAGSVQTIYARDIAINGDGDSNTVGGASIGSHHSIIDASGNVSLYGGKGTISTPSGFSTVAVIGAGSNADISLNVGGNLTLTGGAGATAFTLIGSLSGQSRVGISVGGKLLLDGTSFANTAIGNSSGPIDLAAEVAGNIELRGAGTRIGSTTTATNNHVVLATTGGNFLNSAGNGVLSAPGGTWQVWSRDPALNTLGGLTANAKHYNESFVKGVTPVYASSGNWLFYSIAPVLTVTPTVNGIVYGSTDPVIDQNGYNYSGFIDGDTTLTAGLSGTGNFAIASYTPSGAGYRPAGSYGVTMTTPGSLLSSLGYQFTGGSATLTVSPATAGVTGLTAHDKVYDAKLTATVTSGSLNGILAGDNVALIQGTDSFSTKDVGISKVVTLSGYGISGTDAANYTLTAPGNLTASITPASLSISGATAQNKVYDGTTAASLTTGSLSGVYSGDTVTLTQGTASFSNAQVGTGKPVSISGFSISGTDAGNYLLSQPAGSSANITPATLVYVANRVTVTTGQPLPAIDGIISGFVANDTLANAATGTLTWSTLATETSPAGSYTITGGGLSAINYTFTQDPGNSQALTLAPPPVSNQAQNSGTISTQTQQTSTTPSLSTSSSSLSTTTSTITNQITSTTSITQTPTGSTAFAKVNLASFSPAAMMAFLNERHQFKNQLFQEGISKLELDPTLGELPECKSAAAAAAGGCIASREQIKQLARKAAKLTRAPKVAAIPQIARKIALLIGNNTYDDSKIPSLESAIPDVEAIGKVLEQQLGYEVRILRDSKKGELIKALNEISAELDDNDSIALYYAGHGYLVEKTKTGYWIPADGKASDPSTWISNNDIAKFLSKMPAKQIMLVSDSCYSGSLTRGGGRETLGKGKRTEELLDKRSVVVMSSGGEEPVSDEGKDGHSIFAYNLVQALTKVKAWQLGANLYEEIRDNIAKDEFPQTPEYGSVNTAGHVTGGEYLFEAREYHK